MNCSDMKRLSERWYCDFWVIEVKRTWDFERGYFGFYDVSGSREDTIMKQRRPVSRQCPYLWNKFERATPDGKHLVGLVMILHVQLTEIGLNCSIVNTSRLRLTQFQELVQTEQMVVIACQENNQALLGTLMISLSILDFDVIILVLSQLRYRAWHKAWHNEAI